MRDQPADLPSGGVTGVTGRSPALWRRWPTAVGLGVAGLLLINGVASRETLAIGASVAAFCYLAAAALGQRWVAWAAVPGASLVLVLIELIGLPRLAGLGVAGVVLVVVGLLRAAPRPVLFAQAAALTGIGTLAVIALALEPRAGVVLAGLVLAGHAVWDAVHFRRDLVVPRSLAEACMGFDLLLGIGLIAVVLIP